MVMKKHTKYVIWCNEEEYTCKEKEKVELEMNLCAVRYMKGAIDLLCYLGAASLRTILSCIDASFETHPDFKSYTGATATFGISVTSLQLSKQKLNTRSWTESEVVGVADQLLAVQHQTLFVDVQGYLIKNNTMC